MALERVALPTPTAPTAPADYTAILAQLEAKNQAFTGAAVPDLVAGVIRGGRVFDVGGVLYKATSDTTITGTDSIYVKITPSGASATAEFVASLTGVTWNEAYGGYYDGSGNLYIFDEARAVYDGVVTNPKTVLGQVERLKVERLRVSADLLVDNDATIENNLDVNSLLTAANILSNGLVVANRLLDTDFESGITNSGTLVNSGTIQGGDIFASHWGGVSATEGYPNTVGIPSFTVTSSSPVVLPQGLYLFPSTRDVGLQIASVSTGPTPIFTWRGDDQGFVSGLVLSNGEAARLVTPFSSRTVYYRKLA